MAAHEAGYCCHALGSICTFTWNVCRTAVKLKNSLTSVPCGWARKRNEAKTAKGSGTDEARRGNQRLMKLELKSMGSAALRGSLDSKEVLDWSGYLAFGWHCFVVEKCYFCLSVHFLVSGIRRPVQIRLLIRFGFGRVWVWYCTYLHMAMHGHFGHSHLLPALRAYLHFTLR